MQSTVKGNTLNVRLSLHWRSSCTGCLKLWGCTVQVCRKVPASPSTSHLLQSRAVVYLPEEKIPLCFYIPAFHSTVDRTVASQKHTDTLVLEHFRHSPYRRNKVELFLHCFVFFFLPSPIDSEQCWNGNLFVLCSVMLMTTAYWRSWGEALQCFCHCSSLCFVFLVQHLWFTAFVIGLKYCRNLLCFMFSSVLLFLF